MKAKPISKMAITMTRSMGTILWFGSLGMMQIITVPGQVKVCQPKPNGKRRPGEAATRVYGHGATPLPIVLWLTIGVIQRTMMVDVEHL